MDAVYLVIAVLLWAVVCALAWGCNRLLAEREQRT